MRILTEEFNSIDGVRIVATLDVRRQDTVLCLRSDDGQEDCIVGAARDVDELTSDVVDLVLSAEYYTWDQLQDQAERMLSHDFWNTDGGEI